MCFNTLIVGVRGELTTVFRSRRRMRNVGINTSRYIAWRGDARGVLTAHWRFAGRNGKEGRFIDACSILEKVHTARKLYQSSNFPFDTYESGVISDQAILPAQWHHRWIYGDPPILSIPAATILPVDTRFRASSISLDNVCLWIWVPKLKRRGI